MFQLSVWCTLIFGAWLEIGACYTVYWLLDSESFKIADDYETHFQNYLKGGEQESKRIIDNYHYSVS